MDEPKGNDYHRDSANDSDSAPIASVNIRRDDREKLAKDHTNSSNTDHQPSQESLWRRWQSHTLPERLMAYFTFVIAVCAGIQVWILASGSAQTNKLITAANTQAAAATNIAGSAAQFTQSTIAMKEKLAEAVADFKTAADQSAEASKTAAGNAERTIKNAQDSFRAEQRAWVGVQGTADVTFTESGGLVVSIIYFNSGRTPARNVQTSVRYKTTTTPITGPSAEEIGQLTFRPAQSIPPQGSYRQNLANPAPAQPSTEMQRQGVKQLISDYKFIKNGELFLYYFGILKYEDVSGNPHETQFCVYLAHPDTKEMGMCDSFNDLN